MGPDVICTTAWGKSLPTSAQCTSKAAPQHSMRRWSHMAQTPHFTFRANLQQMHRFSIGLSDWWVCRYRWLLCGEIVWKASYHQKKRTERKCWPWDDRFVKTVNQHHKLRITANETLTYCQYRQKINAAVFILVFNKSDSNDSLLNPSEMFQKEMKF